ALGSRDGGHVVAGFRPRAIDGLFPLRFLAVVVSVVANGLRDAPKDTPLVAFLPVSVLLLVLVAVSAYGFLAARQIDAGPEGLTLRSFAGERHLAWPEVTEELLARIPRRAVRGPLLTTSPWTKHAHERVIAHAKREMKKRRD